MLDEQEILFQLNLCNFITALEDGAAARELNKSFFVSS